MSTQLILGLSLTFIIICLIVCTTIGIVRKHDKKKKDIDDYKKGMNKTRKNEGDRTRQINAEIKEIEDDITLNNNQKKRLIRVLESLKNGE